MNILTSCQLRVNEIFGQETHENYSNLPVTCLKQCSGIYTMTSTS